MLSRNKLIWDRCSKEVYAESMVIKDATWAAISYFNHGSSSIIDVMHELGLEPGLFTANACRKHDTSRIQHSQHKSSEWQKKRHKHLRAVKKGFMDTVKDKEGNVYEKGAH